MFPWDHLPDVRWHCLNVVRPAMLLAPANFLGEVRDRLTEAGVMAAVTAHDTAVIYNWLVRLLARQGISNRAAEVYATHRGSPTYASIERHVRQSARCPRLRGYWTYADCGYRRSTGTCNTPHHLVGCLVPTLPARKGALAEAAIGLALFIRDIANGDFIGWIDHRLAHADPGQNTSNRAGHLRAALLDPLVNIPGTGQKVWSMILAELLLGADPDRERWVTAGASFIAVDSLVHNFMHRTGILQRFKAAHVYGPACHASGGCVDVITALAARIDAREFNPSFPACFPRWVQFALWWFCAEGGWAICNSNKVDDAVGCVQKFCPAFQVCRKIVIKPHL